MALMQPAADFVGRIGVAATLVTRHQHPTGGDADDPRQSDPLPDTTHTD